MQRGMAESVFKRLGILGGKDARERITFTFTIYIRIVGTVV
jgi:hypothetical protein